MVFNGLKLLLRFERNEVIDGLNNGMSLTITDLSKCKISNHPIIDKNGIILDITESIKFLIKTSNNHELRSLCNQLSNYQDYPFVSNIKRIVWSKKTKRNGSFLCEMNNEQY